MPHTGPSPLLLTLAPLLVCGAARIVRATDLSPKLSGWIDTYYGWNFNRPHDGASFVSATGTSGKRANEFSISQAAIELAHGPAPLGYELAVGVGTGFDVVHEGEPSGPGVGPNLWRYLLTADVSYLVPVGRGLTLTAGVYPSYIGFESFPSQENWNYTRSWLGEFSPYYEAGIRASYSFSPHLSAQLHLMNGWQNIVENNAGKAVGAQLAWTADRGSLTLNGFAGPERRNDGADWRLFGQAIGELNASSAVSLALSADFGRQEEPKGPADGWFGLAIFAREQLAQRWWLAERTEVYRDPKGVITGVGETLSEGTLTLEMRPVEHLILKVEGRYDHSTAAAFELHGTGPHGAPTFGAAEALAIVSAVATF